MPTWRRPGSGGLVRAKTRMKSASSAKVHHILEPVMTHSSPSRSARVETAAASEPASGSERAKAPRYSPRAMGGRYWRFCSSRAWRNPSPFPRAMMLATLIQARASSSVTRAYSKEPSPSPPYSGSMRMPK